MLSCTTATAPTLRPTRTARRRRRLRIRDGWGGWVLAYLVIEGKSLLIYHHDGGETAVPGPQEKPHRTADLTGATVSE